MIKIKSVSFLKKQSQLLYRISNALLKIDDFKKIIDKAADEMINAIDAYTVSIALLDKDTNKLIIEIIKRKNGVKKIPKIKEFSIGEGVAGLSAQKREIIFVPNIASSKIFVGKCRSSAGSLISVPMIFREQLIGVINISVEVGRKFSEKEKEFLTTVSAVIAIAIENSRLVEKIKTENQLLNNVIENSEAGILVVDNNGKILIINDHFEQILSLKNKGSIGVMVAPLLSTRIGSLFTKRFMRALLLKIKEEKNYEEVEISFSTNEKSWLGLTTSFIRYCSNEVIYATIVARDITAEKKLLQTKNDLISTATHELRTPLTAIKGYLSMIQAGDAGELNKKQTKYINTAHASTERLVNLVEDLLKTLKIDENKINFATEIFDAGKVIRESLKNFKNKAKKNKLTIQYNYMPIFAYGDAISSKHVIENLLDNAIKYTPNGGRITVGATYENKDIIIYVKDTGVGIAHEYSKLVFDRFTRVNNRLSVKAGGTGLGLYIAKNLVEKQGGKIWLESKPKKGTTFYFTMLASPLLNNQ